MSNFHSFDVVGRGSETHLQVSENLNNKGIRVDLFVGLHINYLFTCSRLLQMRWSNGGVLLHLLCFTFVMNVKREVEVKA